MEGFHIPWELLELFCSWELCVITNYTGLLIPNVMYLLGQETCFYLFPYFAFSKTGRLLCIAVSIFVALRNHCSNLDKCRSLSGVFYLTISRCAAWLVLPGFILQSRGGHAAAHRLPVAFATVCSMPARNLLKVPVLASLCHGMCPLCFALPGSGFVRLELYLNVKEQRICPNLACLQLLLCSWPASQCQDLTTH